MNARCLPDPLELASFLVTRSLVSGANALQIISKIIKPSHDPIQLNILPDVAPKQTGRIWSSFQKQSPFSPITSALDMSMQSSSARSGYSSSFDRTWVACAHVLSHAHMEEIHMDINVNDYVVCVPIVATITVQ